MRVRAALLLILIVGRCVVKCWDVSILTFVGKMVWSETGLASQVELAQATPLLRTASAPISRLRQLAAQFKLPERSRWWTVEVTMLCDSIVLVAACSFVGQFGVVFRVVVARPHGREANFCWSFSFGPEPTWKVSLCEGGMQH